MSAYIILDIEITDPAHYEAYKKLAPPTIALYEGKYLARGGAAEALEGDWTPNRVVLLEFPTVDKAKAWLNSPEYSAARAMRHAAARCDAIVVEGV